jgi:hypothetical protein
MSYYVYCYVDAQPCPAENQMIAAEPTLTDYAALGLTGESLSVAVGLGFGIIFFFACLGVATASAIKLIRGI